MIYPTDASPGQRPERIVVTDPRGHFHQVQLVADVRVDIDELDDTQVLRLAQYYFTGPPRRVPG
jgi:hypothetical protein